jgi:hypothetical protein
MDFWILLWKATLIIGLTAFTILAIGVTYFGALDVKHLLKTLKNEQENKG